jgi:hypothetical protein
VARQGGADWIGSGAIAVLPIVLALGELAFLPSAGALAVK